MPRYGFFAVRAYPAARILPSTPRPPKPPGTRIPSAFSKVAHAAESPPLAALPSPPGPDEAFELLEGSPPPFSSAASFFAPSPPPVPLGLGSSFSASTHCRSSLRLAARQACWRALITER